MGEAKEWVEAIGHFISSGGIRTGPSQAEKESEKEREKQIEQDDDDNPLRG